MGIHQVLYVSSQLYVVEGRYCFMSPVHNDREIQTSTTAVTGIENDFQIAQKRGM